MHFDRRGHIPRLGCEFDDFVDGLKSVLSLHVLQVTAVVVGLDMHVNFYKLQTAMTYIRENKAIFVVGCLACITIALCYISSHPQAHEHVDV